ncbi:MAG: AAA family ATPase [Actinomycetota bacterium]|nr:AAA family ATPase [Actinomycetota bacterium]
MSGGSPQLRLRFEDLLERENESAAVLSAIDGLVRGDGAAMAFEGDAGVGKTALIRSATATAEERGSVVLAARAVELEHDLAYGAVRQLLLPELLRWGEDGRATLLQGAASLAGVVLGFPVPAPAGDPTGAALHGLYWLCVNLAERRPIVLALDDAHWADAASLRFLAYLARRLEGLPILILVAARPAEPTVGHGMLAQLLVDAGLLVLRPARLSAAGTAELVRRQLGLDVPDALCGACHAATGGNPFLVGELLQALRSEGDDPATASASTVARIGPESIARSVLVRLVRLPPVALDLARAVAIFPGGAELRHAAAVAGAEYAEAARAADLLAEVGILSDARPLSFLHPVMRSAVYDDLPAGARALLHLRAAGLLRSEGADAATVSAHLLGCDPGADPAAFADLVAAGGAALAAGAPEGACRYLDRALLEPVPVPARAGALHLRGVARMLTADPRAVDDLRAASTTIAPGLRAAALRDLGRVLAFRFEIKEAVAALDEAIASGAGGDEDLLARCVVDRAWILWSHEDVGARFVAEMVGLAVDEKPEGFLQLALSAYKAFWESWSCADAERATSLAARALATPVLAAEGFDGLPPVALGAVALTVADRPRDATAGIAESIRELGRAGTTMGLTYGHLIAGMVHLYAGDLREADSDLQVGAEMARNQPGDPEGQAAISALMSAVALDRTGPGQAERLLDGLATPPTWLGVLVHAARGRVHHALGRFDAALEAFEAAYRAASANGLRNPLYPFAWHTEFALAAAGVGEQRLANELADADLELAHRFGSPAVLGAALRTAGLLQRGGDGIGLLEAAVEALAGSSARLLHAKALADLGAALRRSRQPSAARDPLRLAVDIGRQCAADRLVAFAIEELRATGARPRRERLTGVDALTPSERRVARLAAAGQTNQQIAQQLFLTVRTIEMHVSNALSKLAITSRRQLAAVLDSSDDPDLSRGDGPVRGG